MDVQVKPGKYVVAVSGGVDSMVLLDVLAKRAEADNLQLVVAHFDHGIRDESSVDRRFVQRRAAEYGLPFVYDQAALGKGASEAKARDARYEFLRKVAEAMKADAVITAHHQDDLLETIIINVLRGTKSKGLSSLQSRKGLLRPLLPYPKAVLLRYAEKHALPWHEDSTNADEAYLRNYVRRRIMPKLDADARSQLLDHSEKAALLNSTISELTNEYLAQQPSPSELDRVRFRGLPAEVAHEVLAEWLRREANATITTKLVTRLRQAIDTGRNGSHVDIARGYSLELARETVTLLPPR